MAQQIKKKFIKNDAIDGSKIKLLEGQSIRIDSPAGEIELLKLGENGELISAGQEVAFKAQVDALEAELQTEEQARIDGDSQLAASLESEVSRATSSEEALDSKIDQEISDRSQAMSAEESARISGDENLQNQINNILSNVDPEALDSLTEIVSAFQGADSDLQGAISALSTSAASALAQEVSDRQEADQVLQSSIDAEASAREANDQQLAQAISTVGASVTNETLNRMDADSALSSQIDSVSQNLSVEVLNRENADFQLSTQISVLESSLLQKIEDEEDRATLVEEDLQNQINSIISNVDPEALDSLTEVVAAFQNADSDLQEAILALGTNASSALAQEISDRQAGDSALDSRIDSLILQTSHVFIDPVNGVDEEVVGRGSQLKPFQSLGYAYSKVPSAGGNYTTWAAQKIIFNLAPGSYSENVTLGFKRARVAISGTGVIFTGDVTVKSVRSDYPGSGSTFNRNLLPAPWTGAFPSPTFELMGVGAGTEGAFVADSMIFTKTIRFEQESAGNINWQAVIGSHFIALSKVQLQNGLHVTHQNPGLGSTYTAEIDGCSISGGNIGVVPYASGETLSSSMQLNVKAHSSQLNSTMGPRLTIQKLDSCRVGNIDVTLGGVYSGNTNASIRTVDNESTSGIVNCSFNGSIYKIGQAAGTGTITYKMDAASFGSLSSKTLDLGSGTVAYNLVDKASGIAASTAPVNYTRSASTVEASLVGVDAKLGALNQSIEGNAFLIGDLFDAVGELQDKVDQPSFEKMKIVIGTDLEEVQLNHEAIPNSLVVSVGRLLVHLDEDFEINVVEGKTTLYWINALANPDGLEKIETGDVVFVSYAYIS
jgi:hypothetical protein